MVVQFWWFNSVGSIPWWFNYMVTWLLLSAAMADLIAMMNTLVDEKGNILVEGLSDTVAPVTKEELESYKNIDFDVEDYRKYVLHH